MATLPSRKNFWGKKNPFAKNGAAAVMLVAFEAGMELYVHHFAERVEAHAKAEAPWEDQSGAARDGLHAEAHTSPVRYVIVLAHGVDYGIWLEVRWGGRFAVIMPTLETMGPQLMSELRLAELIRMGHGV